MSLLVSYNTRMMNRARRDRLLLLTRESLEIIQKSLQIKPVPVEVIFLRRPHLGEYSLLDHKIFIDPRRRSYVDYLSTLCHECIHARQAQRGDLYLDRALSKVSWRGRWYSSVEYKHWWELPWEKEAYSEQHCLLEHLMKEMHLPRTKRRIGNYRPLSPAIYRSTST